jgi:hypothetical protein
MERVVLLDGFPYIGDVNVSETETGEVLSIRMEIERPKEYLDFLDGSSYGLVELIHPDWVHRYDSISTFRSSFLDEEEKIYIVIMAREHEKIE